tara:strand:- start:1003 stop:1191 length:189 start_codon:yes stop_codon:yes gene_type:complete
MKRNAGESYEDYKKRRAEDNAKTKRRLKGIKVWPGDWGTYDSSVDGAIESRLKKIMDKVKNK